MQSKKIRLQLFMAQAGIASRRKSEELIDAGKVFVNGVKAKIGTKVDPEVDEVEYNGKTLKPDQKLRYFLVYKPVGIISSTKDEIDRETVLELLPRSVKERLYPVGRLDKDSEGLMLLTNDGALAQKLTHPSYQIEKTYHVLLDGIPSARAMDHLRRGVRLTDGYATPIDAKILLRNSDKTALMEITINEGRNHQVRRMMKRIGYETLELVRIQMGPFHLDMLDDKKFLELSQEEVEELIAAGKE